MENRAPICWCGSTRLVSFSPDYLHCCECESLVVRAMPDRSISRVVDDDRDFYGSKYFFAPAHRLPNIEQRAERDLSERCLHWLRTLLRYKSPPAKVLELGSAHGGFVCIL